MTKKMPTILSIGKATQDIFMQSSKLFEPHEYKGVQFERLPLGQKLHLDEVVYTTGGNASNAAVTFARQGLHSKFLWFLGEDISSDSILQAMDREGIDTSPVQQVENFRSSLSVILMASSGERTILNYPGTKVSSRDGLDLSSIKKADWLYLSSLNDIEMLEDIIGEAKKHDVKVMLNPASTELEEAAKLRALLEDVDVLITNKEEAQQIVEGSSLEELVRHAYHYVPVVIVSDGPHGAVATDGETVVAAGMYDNVKVIDRTGGGDAFGSGFLSYWAQGKSLKESIVFASANSTSVVTMIGAKAGILYQGTDLHDMPLEEKDF